MSIGNLVKFAVLLVFEVWILPRMEMFYKGLLIELYPRESKFDEPLYEITSSAPGAKWFLVSVE